jgi:heme exporter protein B
MLRWIVWRDLMLAWRRRADMLSTVFFFVIVVSLFPLGIGPETQLLRTIAPGCGLGGGVARVDAFARKAVCQ